MQKSDAFEFIALSALWGAAFLFIRLALPEFGAVPTAFVRVLVAALVLLPLLMREQRVAAPWNTMILVGVLNSGLSTLLIAYALLFITTGLVAVLNATVPVFAALLARYVLGERLSRSRVAGLFIAFGGIAMLMGGEAGIRESVATADAALALGCCLGAAVSYAVGGILVQRRLGGIPVIQTASTSLVAAATVLCVPALLTWPAAVPGLGAWSAVIASGAACTAGSTLMYFRLVERIGQARALSVTFVMPLFTTTYGALFLDESVTPWTLLCGAIVLCGTTLAAGLTGASQK